MKIVIGAGYGDEGKGLLTDYYASKFGEGATVIRFNGGAQAGHTVTLKDGRRHIFSHFGSGTLAGAKTYLSKFFVINPILFLKELDLLKKMGVNPNVTIDPNCLVTTPYDMILNQIAEASRGDGKHGSCGVGFNETIERNLNGHPRFKFTMENLILPDRLEVVKIYLRHIRDGYVPHRLRNLGIYPASKEFQDLLNNDNILDKFASDLMEFKDYVSKSETVPTNDRYIFEGAQGLMLDEDHPFFPHVTRSKTGLHNVVKLAKEMGHNFLDVTYVTRCYATRHGAGPFPTEVVGLPYKDIVDLTNKTNTYQGALRFGYLDVDMLSASIRRDLMYSHDMEVLTTIAITCLDQVNGAVKYKINGKYVEEDSTYFINEVIKHTGVNCCFISNGPERKNVVKYS